MDQIETILKETQEQLEEAEQKADEQAERHQELTGLAARSDTLLDTIRQQSEDVSIFCFTKKFNFFVRFKSKLSKHVKPPAAPSNRLTRVWSC